MQPLMMDVVVSLHTEFTQIYVQRGGIINNKINKSTNLSPKDRWHSICDLKGSSKDVMEPVAGICHGAVLSESCNLNLVSRVTVN